MAYSRPTLPFQGQRTQAPQPYMVPPMQGAFRQGSMMPTPSPKQSSLPKVQAMSLPSMAAKPWTNPDTGMPFNAEQRPMMPPMMGMPQMMGMQQGFPQMAGMMPKYPQNLTSDMAALYPGVNAVAPQMDQSKILGNLNLNPGQNFGGGLLGNIGAGIGNMGQRIQQSPINPFNWF